jgi:flagellar basal-body rod protein FlgG
LNLGIYNLVDGALIQQQRIDIISNNLANVNTDGFKKDVITFEDTLTMIGNSETDFSPGPVRYTGSQLDVALGTGGFFKIDTPNGIRYTRDGSFTRNAEGMLVTHNGDTVLGQNGPIHIDGSKVTIGSNGQVEVDDASVDTLVVVDFKQPHLLKKEGASHYLYQGEESGVSTPENIVIRQNYLESSNVNSMEEMVKMIEAHRLFESVQKAMNSMDQASKEMINVFGTLQ